MTQEATINLLKRFFFFCVAVTKEVQPNTKF